MFADLKTSGRTNVWDVCNFLLGNQEENYPL